MTLWTEVRRNFRETMGENLSISISIYSGLGALIAIGVVYNAARIQLSERAHELASLRILGFSRGEVSFVLLGELLGLALLAIPARLPPRLRLRRLDRLGLLDRYPDDPAGDHTRRPTPMPPLSSPGRRWSRPWSSVGASTGSTWWP